MDFITHLWQYLASIPADTWAKFFEGVTASGLVALALQWLKTKFDIDGKRVIVSLLSIMSAVVSVAGFLVLYGSTTFAVMVPELAQIWTFIMVGATLIHRFALSPAYKRIRGTLSDWAEFKASKTTTAATEPDERPKLAE